jgi:hypothetical protein
MEQFVAHFQGPDYIYGLLGSLYGNKVCSKGGNEVVPGAIVYSVSGEGSGPFSHGHPHFEVGQGSGNFLRVATIEVAI